MEESQEFKEKKELIKLEKDSYKLKHKLKMDQLKYERDNQILAHENDLEKIRIKSAEIRRSKSY